MDHDPEAREIRAEIAALDRQYLGRRFPEDEKARWNDLNERLEEIETRNERIRELNAAGSIESTTDDYRRTGTAEQDAALWTIDRFRQKLSAEAGDRLEHLVRHGGRRLARLPPPGGFVKRLRTVRGRLPSGTAKTT